MELLADNLNAKNALNAYVCSVRMFLQNNYLLQKSNISLILLFFWIPKIYNGKALFGNADYY